MCGGDTQKERMKLREWKRGRHERFLERERKVDGKKRQSKREPFNYTATQRTVKTEKGEK